MIVFDDFYSDPYAIRKAALGLTYDTESVGTGVESHEPIPHKAMTKLAELIGDFIWWESQHNVQCVQLLHSGHAKHQRPHVHGDRATPSHYRQWCAEITLTLPEHVRGSLDIFTCRKYKTSVLARHIDEDDFGSEGFDKLLSVPLKFNRCILFEANIAHALSKSAKVGTKVDDGSLTHTFFFCSGYNPAYNNG